MERHHLLFNRFAYESNTDLRAMREDRRLIVPLDHDTHKELHERVSHVPPVSYHIARRALINFKEYNPADNPIHDIDNLQFSIQEAIRHPRADLIEREVGELAIYALDIQKPFIQEDLPTRLAVVHHDFRVA